MRDVYRVRSEGTEESEALSATESEVSTGEAYWDGKDEGLCFCGASPEEHERAFMNYYLFGDKPESIFSEGATSLDDIDFSHYFLLLDFLSESDFVYEGHRRYFKRELDRALNRQEKFKSLPRKSITESLEERFGEVYASCTPRPARARYASIIDKVLNGSHRHQFERMMSGDLRCTCGASLSPSHDLGERVIAGFYSIRGEMGNVKLPASRIPRRAYEQGFCIRCGAVPMPCWVSRGRIRLGRWHRAAKRALLACWTQLRQPVPWSLLMLALGGVLSNWIAGWWPL